jgi:3-phenylpropionate/cinnamic acid dioxygenase small subunit
VSAGRLLGDMDASVRDEIADLYAAYVDCLDNGELEQWPEFFTDACLYKIIPRENFERGLPLALVLCESKGMLRDRVEALRRTSVYAPRALRHLVSSLRITPIGRPGPNIAAPESAVPEEAVIRVQANYAVFQTLVDEPTQVFNVGRYIDQMVRQGGQLKFREKLCVFDSVLVPGSLIYPL